MPHIIAANSCFDAWQAGSQHLIDNGREVSNLITVIDNPANIVDAWVTDHDPEVVDVAAPSVRDVINTIFPMWLASRSASRDELYNRYNAIIQRARGKVRWGTYFHRLISFGPTNINQLEDTIAAINRWTTNSVAAHYFHTMTRSIDAITRLGGPCLQYIQLDVQAEKIDMTVLYRNHDYLEKTLGNFLALGQLLKFTANACNRLPGQLVCHSVHAYTDSSSKLRTLAQL